jgi:hypothetical protein
VSVQCLTPLGCGVCVRAVFDHEGHKVRWNTLRQMAARHFSVKTPAPDAPKYVLPWPCSCPPAHPSTLPVSSPWHFRPSAVLFPAPSQGGWEGVGGCSWVSVIVEFSILQHCHSVLFFPSCVFGRVPSPSLRDRSRQPRDEHKFHEVMLTFALPPGDVSADSALSFPMAGPPAPPSP